jgi:hypothetical protein
MSTGESTPAVIRQILCIADGIIVVVANQSGSSSVAAFLIADS